MSKTITVKGVGSVSAKPDYVTISMTIETVNTRYDEAMEEAAGRIERLKAAAVCAGYEKDALKTVSFRVETRYDNVRNPHGGFTREFAGYACLYRLKLAFDLDGGQLARVIGAIADSGAKPEVGISFTVKDPAGVSEELLVSATENARAKAEILCRASGNRLGELLSIDYNWGELNIVSPTSYDMGDSVQPMMLSQCAAPEIEPEEIRLTDTVTFVWALVSEVK